MSILSWLGRAITLRDGPFWAAYLGGETWAGKPVTEAGSLNLSAWWRGVRLYGDVTGAMPVKLYEKKPDGTRIEAPDNEALALLLRDPNSDQTGQEFWSGMAASLAMQGNAYAEKKTLGSRVVSLVPLPYETLPDRSRHSDQRLEYKFNDRGKIEYFPAAKVFHIRGFTIGRSDVGLSPLAAARQALSLAIATEEASGKMFSHGMRASGFFSGPRLSPEQRTDFKKTFIDPLIGNDATNHYGVLENGFKFEPINIPPKDAEMLLSRRFNVEEICRFMGMPPIMVGHNAEGQTAWGTGVESVINMWLTLGYNSFLRYFETSMNKWLLPPEDRGRLYVEYTRSSLLRMDSAARAEVLSKLVQNGMLTINEGRSLDNRSAVVGGDEPLVNSTLVPLARTLAPPAAAPVPEPVEENDDDEI